MHIRIDICPSLFLSVCGQHFYWFRTFSAGSKESAAGGQTEKNALEGPWALVRWALVSRALKGPPRPLWDWALTGRALMGRAVMGPLGPSGPRWRPARLYPRSLRP